VAAIALAAVGSAACGFRPSGLADDDPTGDAAGAKDAATDDGATIDPIDGGARSALCDPADDTLRACFTFAGGAVTNGAGTTLSIDATQTTAAAGPVGDALGLGPTSVVHILETPALDFTTATSFEAFVRLDAAPPTGGRAGIYDDNGEWGVFVDDRRRPYCTHQIVFGPPLELGTWTHVACVFDGATVTIYIDGAKFDMVNRTAPLAVGADGSNIGQDSRTGGTSGDPLTGAIDELRVWSEARTPDEVAAAAARAR